MIERCPRSCLLWHGYIFLSVKIVRNQEQCGGGPCQWIFATNPTFALILKIFYNSTRDGGKIMNYTYIVKCSDGSLYTGWTNDIEKRVKAHNNGKGAKYTKSRAPVKLVYVEEFDTKKEAMKREYEIKHMRRQEKERLLGQGKKQNGTG